MLILLTIVSWYVIGAFVVVDLWNKTCHDVTIWMELLGIILVMSFWPFIIHQIFHK